MSIGKITRLGVTACPICGQVVNDAYAVDSDRVGHPLHSLWGTAGQRWLHCSDGSHTHIETVAADGTRVHTYIFLIGLSHDAPFIVAEAGTNWDEMARANGGIIRMEL